MKLVGLVCEYYLAGGGALPIRSMEISLFKVTIFSGNSYIFLENYLIYLLKYICIGLSKVVSCDFCNLFFIIYFVYLKKTNNL